MEPTVAEQISTTISSLKTAGGYYKAVENDRDLPETFHESGRGLLLVNEALQAAQNELRGRNRGGDPQSVMSSMRECGFRAKASENIFMAVAQAPETSRFEAYKAAVKKAGQDRRVEVLVVGMMNDVCVLAKNHAIKAEMKDQVKKLRAVIEKLSKMEPTVSKEGLGDTYTHFGSGDMLNAPGGTVNKSSGGGNQFPGASFHAPLSFGSPTP